MYTMSMLFLYLLIIKKCVYADVTTLIKNNEITCVVDGIATESAVYLKSLTANVSLEQLKPKNDKLYQVQGEWKSVTSNLGVIIDKRWQDFEPEFGNKISFNIRPNKTKQFGFSICAESNITMSQITKEKKKDTTITNKNNIICEKWFHYKLKVNITNLRVSIYAHNDNTKIASKKFKVTKDNLQIEIESSVQTIWKKHALTYEEAKSSKTTPDSIKISHNGKLCVCMFVLLDKNSDLIINLESMKNKHEEIVKGDNSSKTWQRIELEIESKKQAKLSFLRTVINSTKQGFWAIDDIKLCSSGLEIYQATLQQTNNSKGLLCKLLDKVPGSRALKQCKPGQLGPNCNVTCANIFSNDPYCENYKICNDEGICKCSWGYQEPFCRKACENETWGLDCKMKCKNECENCDHRTGVCKTCKKRFFGKECSEKLPVVLKAPILKNITSNSITIFTGDLQYGEKEAKPDTYLLQYKRSDETNYHNYKNYKFENQMDELVSIGNLNTRKAEYQIRIVLKVQNQFFSDGIPVLQTNKTCENGTWGLDCKMKCKNECENCDPRTGECEKCKKRFFGKECSEKFPVVLKAPILKNIKYNSITIFTEDLQYGKKEAKPDIYVLQYKTRDETDYHNYKNYKFENQRNKSVSIGNLNTRKAEYQIRIVLKVQNQSFSDGIPVLQTYKKSVGIFNATNNSISIKWSPSHYTEAANYVMSYECENQFCPKNHRTIKLNRTSQNIILRKLGFSTKCTVNITEGDLLIDIIEASTFKPNKTNRRELPQNVTFSKNGVEIKLNSCDKLYGPLKYDFEYRCISEWCSGKLIKHNITIDKYESVITRKVKDLLLPFTIYEPTVTVIRFNKSQTKTYLPQITSPGKPNPVRNLTVYCRNSSSLWLRWQEPYPPSGIISSYEIQENNNSQLHSGKIETCTLWDNFNCTIITNLKSGTEYTLGVQAKNKDVDSPSDPKNPVIASTVETASEAPLNLKIKSFTKSEITLSWEHPFRMNGPLKEFHIDIEAEDGTNETYKQDIQDYQKTYDYTIQLEYEQKYGIHVWGRNLFEGEKASINVTLTPPLPELSSRPCIEVCGTICTLLIPKPETDPEKSHFAVLVFENDEEIEEDEVKEIYFELISNKTGSRRKRWLVKTLKQDDNSYIQTEIGTSPGQTPPLENQNYTTCLVEIRGENFTSYRLYEPRNYFLCYVKAALAGVVFTLAIFAILLWSYLGYAYKTRKYPFELRRKPRATLDVVESVNRNYQRSNLWSSFKCCRDNTSQREEIELLISSLNYYSDKLDINANNELTNHYKARNIKVCRKKLALPPEDTSSASKPIKIEDYGSYLNTVLGDDVKNNELVTLFKKVPKTSSQLYTVGASTKNLRKNRYESLIPYNITRVVLNNYNSDYINANYVNSYEIPKGFIATQAPLASTRSDFWWMIWQENVSVIIMLTSLIQNHEQYWPDMESSTVSGYMHRKLEIGFGNITRIVEHLQYMSWANHEVPEYPQNFTKFVKIILRMRRANSPIVVHCSGGCGRTGTLILCDTVLRMVAKEGKVDFLKVLAEMREQRPALVSNAKQYIFAHLVVYDCLFGQDFSIPINDNFQNEVEKVLRKTTVKPLMQYVDNVTIQFSKKIEEDKNRVSSSSASRPQISKYVNAVSVDCYRCPKKFVVTPQPLPNAINHFWRLVQVSEISTIVSLNEMEEDLKFWPTDSIMHIGNGETLQLLQEIDNEHYSTIKIKTNNNKTISIINMKNWKRKMVKPPNIDGLFPILDHIQRSDGSIIITCYDGFTASGLFTALAYLLEKIEIEHSCDVFSAVKTVRDGNVQFVQDWAQFEFLYKAAVTYVTNYN